MQQDLWILALRNELTQVNLQLSSLRLDASIGPEKDKKTYFDLYKSLHEKYVYLKTKRAEEWTFKEYLLHMERENVRFNFVVKVNKVSSLKLLYYMISV